MPIDYFEGKKTLKEFIAAKLARYEKEEKNMQTLFRYMFAQSDYPMAEKSDGYRIKTVTYGECRDGVFAIVPILKEKLASLKEGSLVGLYMQNSIEWIQFFWAILASGFRPLLMNTRMNEQTLESVLSTYGVGAVISDGKTFSVQTLQASDVLSCVTDERAKIEDLNFENEVVFMSSGTTDNVKLCVYREKNFYHQIADSERIITDCPLITTHVDGRLKLLALLPFYHIFGFTAVYMWFGFFARTFVFLKDMSAKTVAATVKKHKVTHIFAVPMVWEGIQKAVLHSLRSQSEKDRKKVEKGLTTASTDMGRKLAYSAFAPLREKIFGDSVKFMISGGSAISGETIKFFNSIGYHLCNGYGMTEIGVTSVELSDKIKILSSATVGKPIGTIEYKISEDGKLLVRGKSIARKIITANGEIVNDYDAWFNTEDLAREEDGRYFIDGRADDLVVCNNGENLNPTLAEKYFEIDGVEQNCIISSGGKVVLIASAPKCYTKEKVEFIRSSLQNAAAQNGLSGQIEKIVVTSASLTEENDFKISRKKIAKKYANGGFEEIKCDDVDFENALTDLEKEIQKIFADALKKEQSSVGVDCDFFTDLGGTSLDYFELADVVKSNYGVNLPVEGGVSLVTVRQICAFVKDNA